MADSESSPSGGRDSGKQQLTDGELQKLVDKVYRLLQAELRLSRARGESATGPGHAGGAP